MTSNRILTTIFCTLATLDAGCRTAPPAHEQSVKPGINDPYKKPDVNEWVERFEVESREIYHERNRIVEAAGIRPGMSMADIGAGTGFFSLLFAEAVGPSGRVFAVDLTPEFIERINALVKERSVRNIQTVLCKEDSVELPPASIDLAFICDTYHHFEYPRSTMSSVRRALRPGGMLIVIDFKRIAGESSDWVFEHVRAGQDVFTREILDAGFQAVDDGRGVDFLKENYLIRFRKRG